MSGERKITISEEVSKVVDKLQRAKEIPLVRAVGEEKGSKDGIITVIAFLVVGLFAGIVTWAAWQTVSPDTESATANMLSSVYLTFSIAIAVPTAGILSFLFGFVANAIYNAMTDATYNSLVAAGIDPWGYNFWTEFAARNHLNRGLAWALLGLAAGLTVGAHSKSVRRILVTGAGGLTGAFIGGFVFDFITGSEDAAQIIGLAITGGFIGLSVSILEQAAKQSWIEIVKGGMAGKQFILYQREVTIGSSPGANITLIKDPAIEPIAAKIIKRGSTSYLASMSAGLPVSVNGQSGTELPLAEGSLIVLGGTELRFREKAKKVKNTAIIRS